MSTSIMTRPANLKDFLDNLFGCSSPVAFDAMSSVGSGSDTFTTVHKDEIDNFHEPLNRQNADTQFTKEIEENAVRPFHFCLVTRDNNTTNDNLQKTDTYRPITRPVIVQRDLS